MGLNGHFVTGVNVPLGVDEDGILVFFGGSSLPNWKGDALLHADGGGGSLLGPALLGAEEVVTGVVLGSHSRSRTEASRR